MGSGFLKLVALASVWIATPLICICTIFYIQHAISQPATNTFPMGLSAFGVTAALSGISFSMARACENPATAKYAGEKFLHSSILLIQTLLVLYIRDTVVESDWLKTWPNLVLTVKIFSDVILGLVSAAAAWAWVFGYSELNDALWKNWEQRIRDINAGLKDKGTGVVPLKADKDVPIKNSSKDATPT